MRSDFHAGFVFRKPGGTFFHVADTQLLFQDFLEKQQLMTNVVNSENRTCMSHRDPVVAQCGPDLRRQFEQADEIGDRRAVLPNPFAELFLGEAALFDQSLVADRHINRVKVLPLDVFDQGHFQHTLIIRYADVGRDGFQSRQLGCTETPFTGDDLVLIVAEFADRDRLDDALFLDRLGKLFQFLRLELGPGLKGFGSICSSGMTATEPTTPVGVEALAPDERVVTSVSALSSRALSPRPSALRLLLLIGHRDFLVRLLDLGQVVLLQDLAGKVEVVDRTFARRVVHDDGLT